MTITGVERLRKELAHLKTVVRPQIVSAIAEARAHGDLKENAEYHAAKDQQGFSEGRVIEIESKLSEAHVIDVTKLANTGKVIFGCTVSITNIETDVHSCYQVVGEDEADIKHAKISVMSPLARALIGKRVGDEVPFEAPSGLVEYEIVKVEHK